MLNGFNILKRSFESKQTKYLMFALWIIGFVTTFHGATRTILPFIFMSIPMFTILNKQRINRAVDVKN
jgi:hypothetical protein